jgi:hypothetical protein
MQLASDQVLCQVVCQLHGWHTTPTKCCANITTLPLAHHSDEYRSRFPFLAGIPSLTLWVSGYS